MATTPATATHGRGGIFNHRRRVAVAPAHHIHHTHHTHTAVVAPVHHQKRHASLGDKLSGALLRLKGSLTGRPGQKAAGTRRMRGTDGRGSRRARRRFF
ncbi:hypothetical protein B0T26DRAFT_748824 [Lasiosphaeria miniovina]|uniref:Uncharacterized protein n=1 Tax=Lasiosphaeria miniovina TaxID=1954250 RepID=A0AA40B6K7_9PEZI|nr:uncharacterized protein B0T26DRAFT_748824 [Lasiosphaeria miniovina]KAK0728639.1 hypothetical protein B0T26DRAFT_748824 [Lasiosphaeria miniovina]